ncbi:MAG: DNA topoisomerase VI subunit B [Promethearchaeota archaeon]
MATNNSNTYEAISPADFFYRNRDIAGFDNPARALYTAVRELMENSLDACEESNILPDLLIRLTEENDGVYQLRVEDNGGGIPRDYIQQCFGQILYGSKYKHKQARGRFGLGGKMAYLYGQITTHNPLHVITSTDNDSYIYDVKLRMDIQRNVPELLSWDRRKNNNGWNGTIVEFSLEGDWMRSKSNINEYVRETALITPYANITFIDPRGVLSTFHRKVKVLPPPSKLVKPHPHGIDIEHVRRLIEGTKTTNMGKFLATHFHRVGKGISRKFLTSISIKPNKDPRSLTMSEIVKLVHNMRSYEGFLPPAADCLSPLGEEMLETGIRKELDPEFIAVVQRPPSSYGGHPFITEVGLAYGGDVPLKQNIILYRFANRIPLIYDEYKDVSAKVLRSINWTRYKIRPGMAIAVFVHIISTKIPFKTAGKEFIADRIEIEGEIRKGVLACARRLMRHLHRKERVAREKQRLDIYGQYLPIMAENISFLADKRKIPNLKRLLVASKRQSGDIVENKESSESSKEGK